MVFSGNRVLIAEDHAVSRHLLERLLMNWGFTVVAVKDGEEALSVLEGGDPPELAILDWMMPNTDGVEVCSRVRNHGNRPYVYLILLTAKNKPDEIAEGLKAGADDYVVKPFVQGELQARLRVGQRVVALERELARKTAELDLALAQVKKLKKSSRTGARRGPARRALSAVSSGPADEDMPARSGR
jgi:DNA-binding response OmpR family regulator